MDRLSEIGENELALLCSKGDDAARRELYNRYAARLSSFCSRYSNGPTEGNDLMHDTMIKALQKIGQYRYHGPGSLYSWLARIAVNLALDRMKRNANREVPLQDEDFSNMVAPEMEDVRSIPLPVLQNLISRLPDFNRMIFNMFCIDGYSHKEIAEILGIRERTSSSSLAKAKKALAKMINDYFDKNR